MYLKVYHDVGEWLLLITLYVITLLWFYNQKNSNVFFMRLYYEYLMANVINQYDGDLYRKQATLLKVSLQEFLSICSLYCISVMYKNLCRHLLVALKQAF